MKKSTKIMATVLSLVLVAALSIGGTLAFLQAKTDSVINTFTFGNLDLDLDETTGGTYPVIPGADIKKDPKITLSTPRGYDDVDAYVFVKVEEGNWPEALISGTQTRKIDYELAEGWQALEGKPNVYWRLVEDDALVKSFSVLKDDKITVSDSLTKEELANAGSATLTITAYAAQADGMTSALDAWTKAGF